MFYGLIDSAASSTRTRSSYEGDTTFAKPTHASGSDEEPVPLPERSFLWPGGRLVIISDHALSLSGVWFSARELGGTIGGPPLHLCA